jgi:hypothetical protein
MTRFILRTLLGVPAWLIYMALMLPLMLIGFPLVAVLALVMQLRFKYTGYAREGTGLLHWPTVFGFRVFWLWDNDEDGIDGDPWTNAGDDPPKNPAWFGATETWSQWRKMFVWSAWRNSVGNARRLPFFGMDMADPKDMVVSTPTLAATGTTFDWFQYRKLGPYLARYGYRFELKFPWPQWFAESLVKYDGVKLYPPIRYFWLGWRIAQQDKPNTDIGFAFQPWAKL